MNQRLPPTKKRLPLKRTNAWRHESGAYEMCHGPTPACGAYELTPEQISRKLRIYEDIKHGDKDLQEALDTHGTMYTNEVLDDDYDTQEVHYDEITPEEAEIIDIGDDLTLMPHAEINELYDETEFSTDEDNLQLTDSQEDISTDEESDEEQLTADFNAWIAKVSKHNNDHMD